MRVFTGSAAVFALCMSPTMATAAVATPHQSISPLVAVSVFGTQASAQQVCNPATAAAAGAAAVAQGQPGCVLPATDVPPPPVVSQAPPPLAPTGGGFGIAPILLGLLGIAALAALIAGSNDDSDSPASPS